MALIAFLHTENTGDSEEYFRVLGVLQYVPEMCPFPKETQRHMLRCLEYVKVDGYEWDYINDVYPNFFPVRKEGQQRTQILFGDHAKYALELFLDEI